MYICEMGRDYLLLGLNGEARVRVWNHRLLLGEFNRIGLARTIFRNRKGQAGLKVGTCSQVQVQIVAT